MFVTNRMTNVEGSARLRRYGAGISAFHVAGGGGSSPVRRSARAIPIHRRRLGRAGPCRARRCHRRSWRRGGADGGATHSRHARWSRHLAEPEPERRSSLRSRAPHDRVDDRSFTIAGDRRPHQQLPWRAPQSHARGHGRLARLQPEPAPAHAHRPAATAGRHAAGQPLSPSAARPRQGTRERRRLAVVGPHALGRRRGRRCHRHDDAAGPLDDAARAGDQPAARLHQCRGRSAGWRHRAGVRVPRLPSDWRRADAFDAARTQSRGAAAGADWTRRSRRRSRLPTRRWFHLPIRWI